MKLVWSTFIAALATVVLSEPALAQQQTEVVAVTGENYYGVAKALAFGLAAFAAALGQSRAAASALEAIGRNPGAQGQIFVPMIVALALMESIALLAFVTVLVA